MRLKGYTEMGISLIATVKNEQDSIPEFLHSIARQTMKPDEIVIVDGLSTDNTVALIKDFTSLKIRLIEEKCNIARGRNIAISHSTNDIIAVTDAGCILATDWLENLFRQFDDDIDVVAGNYTITVSSFFDACQFSLMGLFKSGKTLDDFVISSRSLAFRKKVWQEIGGYPEWLNYSEDTYFHEQFKAQNFKINFARNAIVKWSLRKNMKDLFKQFFLYMEGDGISGMHVRRHALRFITYGTAAILLWLSITHSRYFLIPLVFGAWFYLSSPFSKLRELNLLDWKSLLAVPAMLVFIDIAKMSGYLSGFRKRIKSLYARRTGACDGA